MQVTIVPSSQPGQASQLFTSYVIDGRVAIDAGCLDGVGSVEDMGRIKHVFLTHSHLDHVATLGPFLDAVYDGSGDCVQIYGNAHTLECLRKDIFNNRLYPDFLHISTFRPPYLVLHELTPGVAVDAGGLRVTPVEVNHVVPTLGFVVEDDHSAVVIPSDTAPTQAIWDEAARRTNLAAVFLECTFPNEMGWLAETRPAPDAEPLRLGDRQARPAHALHHGPRPPAPPAHRRGGTDGEEAPRRRDRRRGRDVRFLIVPDSAARASRGPPASGRLGDSALTPRTSGCMIHRTTHGVDIGSAVCLACSCRWASS